MRFIPSLINEGDTEGSRARRKGKHMKVWQQMLRESHRDIREMRDYLRLTDSEARDLQAVADVYPVCVPDYYLGLVDPADPDDPIRKMCIPATIESSANGSADTSGEGENTVIPGMQHKYRQTVLILSTDRCAMYCRHCFRKRMVGLNSGEVAARLPDMEDYVRAHPEIDNVLVSGGDSFLNPNAVIEEYLRRFAPIEHIRFIRFGTRTPVTLPQRVTTDDGELTDLLARYSEVKSIVVVTQFNHPREVTPEAAAAVRELRAAGCLVRNQTVLLKGVNDAPATLAELMGRLTGIGATPYYVFQCRPVRGVKNQFQLPLYSGMEVVDGARALLSGPEKAFRYAMSHPTGKIEILGRAGEGCGLFKYHQAKHDSDQARIFTAPVADDQCWLDDPFESAPLGRF